MPRRNLRRRSWFGGLVHAGQHPYTSYASPWNEYVLVTTFSVYGGDQGNGLSYIDSYDVIRRLKTELFGRGISSQEISIRLHSVSVYVPPYNVDTSDNFIVFASCDFSRESYNDNDVTKHLEWFEAQGTRVRPAHLHYVWPWNLQSVVMNSSDYPRKLFRITPAVRKSPDNHLLPVDYLCRVHISWRPLQPDPRPSVSFRVINGRAEVNRDE